MEQVSCAANNLPDVDVDRAHRIISQQTTVNVKVKVSKVSSVHHLSTAVGPVEAWEESREESENEVAPGAGAHAPNTPQMGSEISAEEEFCCPQAVQCEKWYCPHGKHPLSAICLLFFYIVFGIIFFPFLLLIFVICCVSYFTPEIE